MRHTYYIFMSYVQLIPSSILAGLAIVIGLTLLLRNYDKITHKCGKMLKLLFSIILASSALISWVLAFMCYSFSHMSVHHALNVAYSAMDDLNARVFPTVTNLIYDYEHRIVDLLLSLINNSVKTGKERVVEKKEKYIRLFQEEVMMFHMPSTVSLQ